MKIATIPLSDARQVNVKLSDPELIRAIDEHCRREHRTRAQVGRLALERLLLPDRYPGAPHAQTT